MAVTFGEVFIWLLFFALLVPAGLVGWAIGDSETGRTVTRTITAGAPATSVPAPAATTATTTATASSGAARLRISTRKLPKLGTVLVNSKGRTLYMFVPDKRKKVTCVHACAAIWPPVRLPKGAKPIASGQVKSSLLGSDPDPTGGRVVTYARWPLYTYAVDTRAGTAKGQALKLNGGLWYVLAPSGKVIRKKP